MSNYKNIVKDMQKYDIKALVMSDAIDNMKDLLLYLEKDKYSYTEEIYNLRKEEIRAIIRRFAKMEESYQRTVNYLQNQLPDDYDFNYSLEYWKS